MPADVGVHQASKKSPTRPIRALDVRGQKKTSYRAVNDERVCRRAIMTAGSCNGSWDDIRLKTHALYDVTYAVEESTKVARTMKLVKRQCSSLKITTVGEMANLFQSATKQKVPRAGGCCYGIGPCITSVM